MDKVRIKRKYSPYSFNSWEVFRNPLENVEMHAKFLAHVNASNNADIAQSLEDLRRNLKSTKVKYLLQKHIPHRQYGQDVDYKSLHNLFRAFGLKVLPKSLLGDCAENVMRFSQNCCILFSAGKMTSIYPSDILYNLKDLNWPLHVMSKLTVWICENLFWNLLTSCFHVTETARGRNRLFFYRKREFQSVLDQTFDHFKAQRSIKFIKPDLSVKIKQKFGDLAPPIARCRLLPKKGLKSVRLIARKVKNCSDIKDKVEDTRLLLEYLARTCFPHTIDVKGILFHSLLSRYLKSHKGEKFYAVICDIKDAFGSVDHGKMVEILKELSRQNPQAFYVHSLQFKKANENKPFTKKFISSQEELDKIPDYFSHFTYLGYCGYRKLDTSSELKLVAKRLKLHTLQLKVGSKRRNYLLTQGIVQGDSLSTPLCNIYYGHLVQKHLMQFASTQNELFARGMDDFIFISTDQEKSSQFLAKMHRGFPDYNCIIQSDKTASNFGAASNSQEMLRFCGSTIDGDNLQCRPDYEGYFGQNVAYATNFCMKFSKSTGAFIEHKMLFIAGLSMKPLFLDEALNGTENVMKNIFELNIMNALKLHSMIASKYFACKRKPPPDFLSKIILKVSSKIQKVYLRAVKSYDLAQNSLTCLQIGNLTKYAFYVVLKEKFSCFYSEHKLPFVKLSEIPTKMLKKTLKERKTFSAKSFAFQRL